MIIPAKQTNGKKYVLLSEGEPLLKVIIKQKMLYLTTEGAQSNAQTCNLCG